jgi:two-component system OmpR family response regulator
MHAGKLSLDLQRCEARWQDNVVILTATEFSILKAMIRWPGKVWSRQELMDKAWDLATHVSDRTIDSHVRRLRQKFAAVGAEPVATVHGFGYRLDV